MRTGEPASPYSHPAFPFPQACRRKTDSTSLRAPPYTHYIHTFAIEQSPPPSSLTQRYILRHLLHKIARSHAGGGGAVTLTGRGDNQSWLCFDRYAHYRIHPSGGLATARTRGELFHYSGRNYGILPCRDDKAVGGALSALPSIERMFSGVESRKNLEHAI